MKTSKSKSNKKSSVTTVPLLSYFPGVYSPRDVFDTMTKLLDNVDLFLREKLSAELRKDPKFNGLPAALSVAQEWVDDLIAMMEKRERSRAYWSDVIPIDCFRMSGTARESLPIALRAEQRISYKTCYLDEDILYKPEDEDNPDSDEIEAYDDADDVFDSHVLPKIDKARFLQFCQPQTKIPDAWHKDKDFRKLVDWLPRQFDYNCIFHMRLKFADEVSEFQDSLEKFFDLGARYLKSAGKRAACEDLLRIRADYKWAMENGDGKIDDASATGIFDGLVRAANEISLQVQYAALGEFVAAGKASS